MLFLGEIMSVEILCAIISVGGVVVGSLLSLFFQYILEKWKNKKELNKVTLELRIVTYADALRYISVLYRLKLAQKNNKQDDIKLALQNEQDLYNKFHPILTIICDKDKLVKYNDLRNEIENSTELSQMQAYEKAIKILDFNINGKDKRGCK